MICSQDQPRFRRYPTGCKDPAGAGEPAPNRRFCAAVCVETALATPRPCGFCSAAPAATWRLALIQGVGLPARGEQSALVSAPLGPGEKLLKRQLLALALEKTSTAIKRD